MADVRASTPTDAAKRVVPDMAEEAARVSQLRDRAHTAVRTLVQRELNALQHVRSRPVLAEPGVMVDARRDDVGRLVDRARRCFGSSLDRAADNLAHTRARVTALSPAATLERGYAVLQRGDGGVVRRPADVSAGDLVRARLAEGELSLEVRQTLR